MLSLQFISETKQVKNMKGLEKEVDAFVLNMENNDCGEKFKDAVQFIVKMIPFLESFVMLRVKSALI